MPQVRILSLRPKLRIRPHESRKVGMLCGFKFYPYDEVFMITLPNVNGEMIIGKGEFAYKKVIEDFNNTSFIGILTYNISQKKDSILLQLLEKACRSNVESTLITNIPKRFKKYFGDSYALAAKKTIDAYLNLLNPTLFGANMSTWFLFENHAKIIVTDNMAYWGSSNFSDESVDNLECGTITTDKSVIEFLKNNLFPRLKEKSVPYYRHDFAKAMFLINEVIELCYATKEAFFQASFIPWEDYDTNFNTVWLFDTHHSGVTRKLLKNSCMIFNNMSKHYRWLMKSLINIVNWTNYRTILNS